MDKFIISNNAMRDSAEYYVVHVLNPVVIFAVKKYDAVIIPNHYFYINNNGVIEAWGFDVHFADLTFPGFNESKVDSIKKRAWRWFRAYLENKSP